MAGGNSCWLSTDVLLSATWRIMKNLFARLQKYAVSVNAELIVWVPFPPLNLELIYFSDGALPVFFRPVFFSCFRNVASVLSVLTLHGCTVHHTGVAMATGKGSSCRYVSQELEDGRKQGEELPLTLVKSTPSNLTNVSPMAK